MRFRFASDDHLVDRVRAGSAPAFETLFERHHRPLLAFCRHMLGSAADAEDAVQHTFMAAYADLMRSDRPIALRPWLYTIARHRCLTVLRARRERPVAELPEAEFHHVAVEVDAREELRETLTDIARLPDDQRAALVLAELGDASHAEIAQILGCRHDKVKALVFQARSTLATGRTARDTPCAEIREQLAVGGLAMRRTTLRRHVRDCDGCREFGEQLRLQRRRLRILLPLAPSLGLKRAVLGAVLGAGGGGTAMTAAVGTFAVGAVTAIASVAIAGGEPSRDARAADERPAPARTASARVDLSPRRAGVRVGRRRATAAPERRGAAAPGRAGERNGPVDVTAPGAEERAQPAAGGPPAAAPGDEKRATTPGPPHEPLGDKPEATPGNGPPNDPPGGGPHKPPAGPPHKPPAGPPHDPPGGPPHDPPGGPPHDPPGGPPHDPPGGPPPGPPRGKPAAAPGNEPAAGKPAAPTGNGPPAEVPGAPEPGGPPPGAGPPGQAPPHP